MINNPVHFWVFVHAHTHTPRHTYQSTVYWCQRSCSIQGQGWYENALSVHNISTTLDQLQGFLVTKPCLWQAMMKLWHHERICIISKELMFSEKIGTLWFNRSRTIKTQQCSNLQKRVEKPCWQKRTYCPSDIGLGAMTAVAKQIFQSPFACMDCLIAYEFVKTNLFQVILPVALPNSGLYDWSLRWREATALCVWLMFDLDLGRLRWRL